MWGRSEQVVPKWSTTHTGESSLMAVIPMLVFLTGLMYLYYFWPPKAGLVVSHAKITCERRSFREISVEFLVPWPACALSPPEDASPPFLQICVPATQTKKPHGKQVRAPHRLSCCRQLRNHGSGKRGWLCRLWTRSESQIPLDWGRGGVPKLNSENGFSPYE